VEKFQRVDKKKMCIKIRISPAVIHIKSYLWLFCKALCRASGHWTYVSGRSGNFVTKIFASIITKIFVQGYITPAQHFTSHASRFIPRYSYFFQLLVLPNLKIAAKNGIIEKSKSKS